MLERAKRDKWFLIATVLILFLLWVVVKTNVDAAQDRAQFRNKLDQQQQEIKKLKDENEKIKISEATSPKKATAKPKPQTKQAVNYPIGCENYRTLVAKYPWNVDTALFVMGKESGCDPTKVSPTNDHGLCQLHNEFIYDISKHIKRCYEKYTDARRGSNNWSAWYAVCTPPYWKGGVWYDNPQPIYSGIKCA